MSKIYLIVTQNHNWDDPISDTVEYVSTSLKEAEEVWQKYYSHYGEMDDSQWCYSADLREYPDGYFLYSLNESTFTVVKHIDNVSE